MNNLEDYNLKKQLDLINETVSNEIYNLGDAFFEKIVTKLNDAIDADYTFIGELDPIKNEITTIALVSKEGPICNFSYALKDTPCENVVGQTACSYEDSVASLFPKDQLLTDMGIEAYTGIPLYNSKSQSTGILVCMFKKPVLDIKRFESILLIFASRAGAELEHLKLYNALDEHKRDLEAKVQERTKELSKKNTELAKINQELETAMGKLSETQTQLIHSEKMASLGILTAGVAHEINNPLNFILGGYAGIKNFFNENKDIATSQIEFYLNSINVGVERASKIVDSLNQFSRTSDNFDEICNVHKIIDDCLLMLNISLKNKIKILKNYAFDEVLVVGNQGKLYQAFLNIFNNAIAAIDITGEIKIKTTVIANEVEIEITDSGHGIGKESMEHILNPFYTTKRPGEGTGLGLSITFSIIKDHKGSLAIDSEEHKYTSVTVTLPLKTKSYE